jgi:hypothetical protein
LKIIFKKLKIIILYKKKYFIKQSQLLLQTSSFVRERVFSEITNPVSGLVKPPFSSDDDVYITKIVIDNY